MEGARLYSQLLGLWLESRKPAWEFSRSQASIRVAFRSRLSAHEAAGLIQCADLGKPQDESGGDKEK
jgi:hypothetical protein